LQLYLQPLEVEMQRSPGHDGECAQGVNRKTQPQRVRSVIGLTFYKHRISTQAETVCENEYLRCLGRYNKRTLGLSVGRGSYKITWNGKNNSGAPVTTGIYFYKIKVKAGRTILN